MNTSVDCEQIRRLWIDPLVIKYETIDSPN